MVLGLLAVANVGFRIICGNELESSFHVDKTCIEDKGLDLWVYDKMKEFTTLSVITAGVTTLMCCVMSRTVQTYIRKKRNFGFWGSVGIVWML